jgi:carbonic anhydrase/acetyltransferase-like protein (isoleucine patch superfamily)
MPIYSLGERSPQLPEARRFWVAPGAHVMGRVQFGVDVGIWFGAVVRGDKERIQIGESSNIQDGAVLHSAPGFPLTIGAHVTVGHRAILHGCHIGAGTLIVYGRNSAEWCEDRIRLHRGGKRAGSRREGVPGRLSHRRHAGGRGAPA